MKLNERRTLILECVRAAEAGQLVRAANETDLSFRNRQRHASVALAEAGRTEDGDEQAPDAPVSPKESADESLGPLAFCQTCTGALNADGRYVHEADAIEHTGPRCADCGAPLQLVKGRRARLNVDRPALRDLDSRNEDGTAMNVWDTPEGRRQLREQRARQRRTSDPVL